MSDDVLRRLEKWLFLHKSRTVSITHDDGYGASAGWEVTLNTGALSITTLECHLEGDFPGLAKTIESALDGMEMTP